jgi:hypothetical protein
MARRIRKEQLLLTGQRHVAAPIANLELVQPRFERAQVAAGKRGMVERIDHLGGTHFVRARFAEVEHIALADVEPVTEALKRRSRTESQTDHLDIKITQGIEHRATRPEVVVSEAENGHETSNCTLRWCDT